MTRLEVDIVEALESLSECLRDHHASARVQVTREDSTAIDFVLGERSPSSPPARVVDDLGLDYL